VDLQPQIILRRTEVRDPFRIIIEFTERLDRNASNVVLSSKG
jgi:hypothetical protein